MVRGLVKCLVCRSLSVAGKCENQGAELMSRYGINVPKGVAISSVEEVKKVAQDVFPKEEEINPMAETSDGEFVAADAKLNFDENAAFCQKEIFSLRDPSQEDPREVVEAFKILTADEKVKAILVNIFGGIMKCDAIASGIVSAAKQVSLKVPVVVRLEGTNVEHGKRILKESGMTLVTAEDLDDATQKAVELETK